MERIWILYIFLKICGYIYYKMNLRLKGNFELIIYCEVFICSYYMYFRELMWVKMDKLYMFGLKVSLYI